MSPGMGVMEEVCLCKSMGVLEEVPLHIGTVHVHMYMYVWCKCYNGGVSMG